MGDSYRNLRIQDKEVRQTGFSGFQYAGTTPAFLRGGVTAQPTDGAAALSRRRSDMRRREGSTSNLLHLAHPIILSRKIRKQLMMKSKSMKLGIKK